MLLKREETMWHQRARANWIQDGDKNTAFFHKVANGRHKSKLIDEIRDDHGRMIDDPGQIAETLRKYFQGLFQSTNNINMNRVLDAIDTKITDDINNKLSVPLPNQKSWKLSPKCTHPKPLGADGCLLSFTNISGLTCVMMLFTEDWGSTILLLLTKR
ncbi:hypothetical protein DH2020_014173 [Rehmannia glutinosa]|uniref:RNA-directed DNA polymerase (Reverse transcriptase) n=1 Tax=Rehmannia glutinosa TaxID=99300 RepID=A0ABR0WVK8_REHGL